VKRVDRGLDLHVLPGSYAICRLGPGDAPPAWATRGGFFSITRTAGELSVVCDAAAVPATARAEGGFKVLAVRGPLELDLTGVLASLAAPLASAGIALFSISTFDTDHVLVRDGNLDRAIEALREAGHHVRVEEG